MIVPTSCEFGALRCRHSVENAGEGGSKCTFCKLSPENENISTQHYQPLSQYKNLKHPILESQKRASARSQQLERSKIRLFKDRSKTKLLRRATKAEKDTEKAFIKATRNSGRSNRDGDHNLAKTISLDTKLQTSRENPVVKLDELDKVCKDAIRAGNQFGALVLRSKNNVGVVVMKEEQFAKLFDGTIQTDKDK